MCSRTSSFWGFVVSPPPPPPPFFSKYCAVCTVINVFCHFGSRTRHTKDMLFLDTSVHGCNVQLQYGHAYNIVESLWYSPVYVSLSLLSCRIDRFRKQGGAWTYIIISVHAVGTVALYVYSAAQTAQKERWRPGSRMMMKGRKVDESIQKPNWRAAAAVQMQYDFSKPCLSAYSYHLFLPFPNCCTIFVGVGALCSQLSIQEEPRGNPQGASQGNGKGGEESAVCRPYPTRLYICRKILHLLGKKQDNHGVGQREEGLFVEIIWDLLIS